MQRFFTSLLALILTLSVALNTAAIQKPAPSTTRTTTAAAPPPTNANNLDGLDEFITSVMKEWKVPGLAIAVVKDGQVILSKGYGYRDVEKKLPVSSRTLFAIGSISKSFTVSLLGMLADEGKLEWDKPVRTYLTDFQLYDKVSTEHMTPRDLVTHRSGLPRHDGLWYGSNLTREQMYERLRHLEPSKDFRAAYQYNNLMFMTAGILAERITGMKWEDLIHQRIFQPLGMATSVIDSQKSADFALPYVKVKEEVKQVPFRNIDEIGPAGSINSSVEEMIRYVQLHMNKGKHNGAQLLSENNSEQMQTPQMVIPGTVQFDELGHASYGLAFTVNNYRGQKLIEHGGAIDGFVALLSFMPRKKIGMIILTNLGGNPTSTIVARNLYDRLLGLDQVDWVARIKTQQEKARKSEEEAKKKGYTPRKEGTSPTHALADYAGSYEHPAYGKVRIEADGGNLKASYNGLSFPLKHFHYDIFEVPDEPLNPLAEAKVTFFYNKKGDVDRLAAPIEPTVSDIVFTRVADEAMKQRSFLEPFAGQYELGPTTVTVALKGESTLTLTIPGQPTYELAPTRGTSFDIKGLNGYSVEFKKDAAGAVTEAVFYQPNGTFVAKRK
jgi:CubicO group peptidase (beta-lactamase class C family)